MALNEMDARLISQGAETTAIGSNALVSVAEGAGQPQKNIQLGNFADSMAKAVPQKTKDQVSITGLYAKTTDGKMVELTSDSVASVVAGLMGNPLGNKTNTSTNLDDYRDVGIYDIIADSSITNQPENAWATLIVTVFEPNKKYIQQVFKPFGSSKYYVRLFNNTEWTSWSRGDNFGYNTLADLASAVAGFLPFVKNTTLTSGDFNEIINNGTYIFGVQTSNFQNAPAVASLEGILFVKVSSQDHLTQLYADIQGGTCHFRSCYGKDWKPWKRLDNFGYNSLQELANALKPLLGLS